MNCPISHLCLLTALVSVGCTSPVDAAAAAAVAAENTTAAASPATGGAPSTTDWDPPATGGAPSATGGAPSAIGAPSAPAAAEPTTGGAKTTDSATAKAKLAEVQARIAVLTERLRADLKERDALHARLRDAELGITAKRRRLENLRGALVVAERRRAELRADETRERTAQAAERAALALQARAAYMQGPQPELKVLLHQSDPAAAGRMSIYYGYFARARAQEIAAMDARVGRIADLAAQLKRSTDDLLALESDAGQEMSDLKRAREERAAALAAVTREVRSGSQELAQLKREEQAEEALIADLNRVLQDFPVAAQQSFAALHGKLPWPVQGRLTARYQEVRANVASGLRWNGVLIETTRGAKVRAAYFGRVVYADWLPGLGLLLIIGHRGNYLTLYGHAEVLYKSVGDWVAPGDVIAAMADAAGPAPQLYFEIRDGRTPKDPKIWLKPVP
jgi:septal ring factor EnvC (AmiA/AmiB activator)